MNRYSGLSDFEINLRVGNIWLTDWTVNESVSLEAGDIWVEKTGYHRKIFDPCNSWTDGGPIIDKNKINIEVGDSMSHMWFAYIKSEKLKYKVCSHVNFNPLRAAMEVFLMMEDAKNEQHLPELPEEVE